MAPHSSTLAWKIPWMEEPGGLQSMGSLRVGHDWATSLSCIGEGNGNPLQCSCLENPRDGGAWWAAVYGVAQSWTRLRRLSSSSSSRVCELGPLSHHLFQGLFSPLVCSLVAFSIDLSPQHSLWIALFTPLDPFSILLYPALWASLVAQQLKNKTRHIYPPAMQETGVRYLSWEDPLEKETASIPLQYSCLENPMDRGACWATVPGVAKSWTQLSN